MEEEKDIMGPELVGVRNWGYRYQRMSFARMVDKSDLSIQRYYTESDIERLITDMLTTEIDWIVRVHWSIPEDYPQQFARVEKFRRNDYTYSKVELES